MARTSRIPHPPGSRYIQIHAWAVAAVGRDAAAVLAELEFRDRPMDCPGQPVATRSDLIAALQGICGRNAIDTALSDLTDRGWIERRALTRPHERGRNLTTVHQYALDAAAIAVYLEGPAFPDSGKPGVPATGPIPGPNPGPNPGIPNNGKEIDAAAAPRASAVPAAYAAAATIHGGGGGKRRRVRPTGIITWVDDDVAAAVRIESDSPPDVIAAAVAALSAARMEPVPGRVGLEIERRAAQQRERERRAAESATVAPATVRRATSEGFRAALAASGQQEYLPQASRSTV